MLLALVVEFARIFMDGVEGNECYINFCLDLSSVISYNGICYPSHVGV